MSRRDETPLERDVSLPVGNWGLMFGVVLASIYSVGPRFRAGLRGSSNVRNHVRVVRAGIETLELEIAVVRCKWQRWTNNYPRSMSIVQGQESATERTAAGP